MSNQNPVYIEVNEYGECLALNIFKNRAGLVTGKFSPDGRFFPRWGEVKVGKDSVYNMPVCTFSFNEASSEESIRKLYGMLQVFLVNLKKYIETGEETANDNPDDDLPF